MADDAASPDRQMSGPFESGDSSVAVPVTNVRRALAVSLALVVALTCLAGWLTIGAYQSHASEQERALFLSVGRQGALNLTTIEHGDADAAVQRILDSSTGAFHDDFQQRAEPFVQVVEQTQSKSEGTVTEAALESVQGDQAQVIVSVSVKTTTAGAAEQPPRLWRMRINVQRTGDEAKMSEVTFVS
jgi:Mce-associated membrane protein